jgi:hypothetical protein
LPKEYRGETIVFRFVCALGAAAALAGCAVAPYPGYPGYYDASYAYPYAYGYPYGYGYYPGYYYGPSFGFAYWGGGGCCYRGWRGGGWHGGHGGWHGGGGTWQSAGAHGSGGHGH